MIGHTHSLVCKLASSVFTPTNWIAMTSFEKFGSHFQLRLFHYLIADKEFAASVLDILQPEFFSNDHYRTLITLLIAHFEKYHTMPSFENLGVTVSSEISDEVELEYLQDVLKKITVETDTTDKDFIEDKTIEFCKQQAMVNAIQDCVPLIKREDYESIFGIIQNAMNAGSARDDGHDYFDQALLRRMGERFPISTGLDLLDKYLSGGLGAGEVGIILAGTGVGKSMMLVFLAAEALLQGLNVLYYTLELSDHMVALRLDTKLTGINLTELLTDSEGAYRERVNTKLKKIRKKTGKEPRVIIKEYPTRTASITTIRTHLMKLRHKGFVPDIILVDYADILKPLTPYKEKRYELESNVEQLRALSGEMKIPVWTASQTNRDGLDTSIVSLKTISESLAKAMVADVIISVGRDINLVEREEACYYLAKNRFGQDKVIFTGRFDPGTLDFRIDQEGLQESEITQQAEKAKNSRINDRVKELFDTKD